MPPHSVIYAIVLVHALVSGYHGWSHDDAAVPNTLAQSLFIVAVVFVSPLLAVALLIRGSMHSGMAISALSMLGALLVGVLFHFARDTPDWCSHVQGLGSQTCCLSAVLLAAVEVIGVAWGGYC